MEIPTGTGPGVTTPDGCAVVQRHPPSWFEEAAEGERSADGIAFRLRDLRRPGPGLLVDAYLTGDGSWVRAVPASRGSALGRSPR